MAPRRTAAALTKASFKKAGKRIETLAKRLKQQVPVGLRVIGEDIMTDVKASRPGAGVPVDTGTLRSSGRVEGPVNNQVTLTFGGASSGYAGEVHENLEAFHRVGEARYLTRGVDRWQANGVSVAKALGSLQKAVDVVIASRTR